MKFSRDKLPTFSDSHDFDVQLFCGGRSFSTHRLLLAASSDFLRDVIQDSFESLADEPTVIILPEYCPKEIEILLSMLYGNVKQETLTAPIPSLVAQLKIGYYPNNATDSSESTVISNSKVEESSASFDTIKIEDTPATNYYDDVSEAEVKIEVEIFDDPIDKPDEDLIKYQEPTEGENVISSKVNDAKDSNNSDGDVDSPFTCDICQKPCHNRGTLEIHVMRHHSDLPHKCSYCPKGFLRQYEWILHERTHTGESGKLPLLPRSCDVCNKTFTARRHLLAHIQRWHKEHPLKCANCPRTFIRQSELTLHEKIHTGEKPHQCATCGKSFRQKTHLQCHERSHTGEKPYKCPHCSQAFADSGHRKNHIISHHNNERPYQCDICGKTFKHLTLVKNHTLTVHGDKNSKAYKMCKPVASKDFVCEFCSKPFRESAQLAVHRRIHTGERPFKCTDCDKAFTQSAHLERHLRTHTGERPYSCEICNRRFANKGNCDAHKIVHSAEKHFECKICNKAFGTQRTLKKHMKNHLEEN